MAKKRVKRILTSAERRQRIFRKRVMRLCLLIGIFLAFIVALIFALRLPFFHMSDIQIKGIDDETKKADITQFVQSELQGNYFFIIPHDQILFYSTNKLHDDLLSKYSFIQKADIKKSYFHTLTVSVQERQPDSLYCVAEQCYFIDSDGYIYAPAASFSTGVYTTFADNTRDASSSPLQTNLTDKDTYSMLQKYVKGVKDLSLTPSTITFLSSREIKMEIENNGYFLISLDRPYDETIDNIKTALDQGVKEFEYVDVRYGNKIYYKDKSDILNTNIDNQNGSTTLH